MNRRLRRLIAEHPPRPAGRSDLDALVYFDSAVFGLGGFGLSYWRDDLAQNPGGTEIVRVTDEDWGIAACAKGRFRSSSREAGKEYGEISSLAVAEEYRGIGLGELMLTRCIDRLSRRPITGLVLQTHVENTGMQELAHKKGFTISRILKNFYHTGVRDAYEMILLQ